MDAIFSMTALQRSPSKVKDSAKTGVVRITEQGQGAYVFCSDEMFEKIIAHEREDAAYEARLLDAVSRGMQDIDEGRYATSLDEAFSRAAEMRQCRA